MATMRSRHLMKYTTREKEKNLLEIKNNLNILISIKYIFEFLMLASNLLIYILMASCTSL